ncbi:MAG TPA: divalent-cation tolerance protein CutA [Caldimonas sp.]|nr:divalent-cation tolerance protein CutA [Caldimonas sp.]
MRCVAISTTVATRPDAERLAHALVAARLAACAQIAAIDSVYVWKDAIQQEPELRIVFKTTEALRDVAIAAIAEHHPYEVPEIHAETLAHVHAPYAAWVEATVRAPAG